MSDSNGLLVPFIVSYIEYNGIQLLMDRRNGIIKVKNEEIEIGSYQLSFNDTVNNVLLQGEELTIVGLNSNMLIGFDEYGLNYFDRNTSETLMLQIEPVDLFLNKNNSILSDNSGNSLPFALVYKEMELEDHQFADIISEYSIYDESIHQRETISGLIEYIDLEGGFFGIVGENSNNYLPINIQKDCSENVNSIISVEGYYKKDVASIYMWGKYFYVTNIISITDPEPEPEPDNFYYIIDGIADEIEEESNITEILPVDENETIEDFINRGIEHVKENEGDDAIAYEMEFDMEEEGESENIVYKSRKKRKRIKYKKRFRKIKEEINDESGRILFFRNYDKALEWWHSVYGNRSYRYKFKKWSGKFNYPVILKFNRRNGLITIKTKNNNIASYQIKFRNKLTQQDEDIIISNDFNKDIEGNNSSLIIEKDDNNNILYNERYRYKKLFAIENKTNIEVDEHNTLFSNLNGEYIDFKVIYQN